MKISNLSQTITIATNVSVLIGIVFLAVELNQNAIGQRVGAKQEMTRQFSDYLDMLLLNPELREINNKGFSGRELGPGETLQWGFLLQKATWYFASMHYQYVSQSLSEDEWIQSKALIEVYCNSVGYKPWWQNNRDNYSSDFVRYIDSHWESN